LLLHQVLQAVLQQHQQVQLLLALGVGVLGSSGSPLHLA
jgi:hypothetical protein